jgi:hypothetical protein
MSYYPTIEEDLEQAKKILENGRSKFSQDVKRLFIDVEPKYPGIVEKIIELQGGVIQTVDSYAAYKLLESFVEEIERFRDTKTS